jgi:hypothetical protein
LVDDELPADRATRGRGSWTGQHRSGGSRTDAATGPGDRGGSGLASRRDRPPPEFDGHDGSPEDAPTEAPDGRAGATTSPAGSLAGPTVEATLVPVPADDHAWLDQEAGPVVRPYTLTGGRSRPFTGALGLLTHVEALYAPDADLVALQPEHRAILSLTRTALSVAELAARLDLPIGVVRVLVGDLIQADLVSTFEADAAIRAPDDNILQAVIDGLRAL